jgi:hypothetical protein
MKLLSAPDPSQIAILQVILPGLKCDFVAVCISDCNVILGGASSFQSSWVCCNMVAWAFHDQVIRINIALADENRDHNFGIAATVEHGGLGIYDQ